MLLTTNMYSSLAILSSLLYVQEDINTNDKAHIAVLIIVFIIATLTTFYIFYILTRIDTTIMKNW